MIINRPDAVRVRVLLCRLHRQGSRQRPRRRCSKSRSASSKSCERCRTTRPITPTPTASGRVKEVLGHVADAERVFSYRLTRIARGDQTPLAGFDENAWAKTAPHRRRPMADVVDEMIAVRRSTLALVGVARRVVDCQQRRGQQQPGDRARHLLDHGGPHQAPPRHPEGAIR